MPFRVSARGNRFLKISATASDFAGRVTEYESAAANQATETSRLIYNRWHSGRPNPPPRPGRPTTLGTFGTLLKWERTGNGLVTFQLDELAEKAPYWEIQEIGTGQSAVVWYLVGGEGKGIAVKAQVGRRLPRGFYWGDEGGGNPTKNKAEKYRDIPSPFRSPNRRVAHDVPLIGQQNLFPVSMAPPGSMVRQARGTIRREIIGKHFVRDGGLEGLTSFREELTTEFREMFR